MLLGFSQPIFWGGAVTQLYWFEEDQASFITMGTRYPEKEMMISWRSFECIVKLSKQAHTRGKVARYKGLLSTLETTFYKFYRDYGAYKEDTIKKVCSTEEAFNATTDEEGVEVPVYPCNDVWCGNQMTIYEDVTDLLQDAMMLLKQQQLL